MDIKLTGDLIIASSSDEGQGGGNGVAALLSDGRKADVAGYLDGSNQTMWNTCLGGGFCEVFVNSVSSDELESGVKSVEKTVTIIKNKRKSAIVDHPDFGKFFLNEMEGFFNFQREKIGKLTEKITFFIDTLPSEDEDFLKSSVEEQLKNCGRTKVLWMSRFLKPTPKIKNGHPVITELKKSFFKATGRIVKIGPGRQSDQGLIN